MWSNHWWWQTKNFIIVIVESISGKIIYLANKDLQPMDRKSRLSEQEKVHRGEEVLLKSPCQYLQLRKIKRMKKINHFISLIVVVQSNLHQGLLIRCAFYEGQNMQLEFGILLLQAYHSSYFFRNELTPNKTRSTQSRKDFLSIYICLSFSSNQKYEAKWFFTNFRNLEVVKLILTVVAWVFFECLQES